MGLFKSKNVSEPTSDDYLVDAHDSIANAVDNLKVAAELAASEEASAYESSKYFAERAKDAAKNKAVAVDLANKLS